MERRRLGELEESRNSKCGGEVEASRKVQKGARILSRGKDGVVDDDSPGCDLPKEDSPTKTFEEVQERLTSGNDFRFLPRGAFPA